MSNSPSSPILNTNASPEKKKDRDAFREAVLEGSTGIQQRAAQLRSQKTRPGAFREPNILYMNQTIEIWNLQRYLANPKLKEEAMRRSEKRRARETFQRKRLKPSRKRFRAIVEAKYQKGLAKNASGEYVEKTSPKKA
ncbi:MAG: hypothetical protein AAGJ35_14680 [Myxococcota bacterium]